MPPTKPAFVQFSAFTAKAATSGPTSSALVYFSASSSGSSSSTPTLRRKSLIELFLAFTTSALSFVWPVQASSTLSPVIQTAWRKLSTNWITSAFLFWSCLHLCHPFITYSTRTLSPSTFTWALPRPSAFPASLFQCWIALPPEHTDLTVQVRAPRDWFLFYFFYY